MTDRTPELGRESFHCPHPACGVFTSQEWGPALKRTGVSFESINFLISTCFACAGVAIWEDDRMIYPLQKLGEAPHPDLPKEILAIYDEAREVAPVSRKSSAGLLRLALQMLVNELEPGTGTIDQKIGLLVRKGLPPEIQQAMDTLRVVGNESVHPGQIDLEADDTLLPALFNLINVIVDQMIARPKQIRALFEALPSEKLAAIERRDTPKV